MQINFLWAHSSSAIEKLHYGIHDTVGGTTLIAASDHGITAIELGLKDKLEPILKKLAKKWPKAKLVENPSYTKPFADFLVGGQKPLNDPEKTITLHIYGTTFQQVVWKELTEIPFGKKFTYQNIADNIGNPNAVRAVGSAIGANPVALIIPCHRVIHTNGEFGNYRWGKKLKSQLLTQEAKLF